MPHGHQTSTQAPAALGTVADIMRPPLTTVERYDHLAAAAYLMKHADATALLVLDAMAGQLIGIITQADVARAVADGKDVNETRVHAVMTTRPTVITPATAIREAAEIMTSNRFRHLPVGDDTGLRGLVDISDVCRALLGDGRSDRG
jgi:CBS domain-containing protein